MFDPLEPAVTFGQEDPVYWQLHRFLHWEDVREAIPRRRPGKSKNDSSRYVTTLSKANKRERPAKAVPTIDQMYLPPPPDYRPVDHRQRLVRQLYTEQFHLPKWMYDDLDRRPSPRQGAVHPWDLNPPLPLEDDLAPDDLAAATGKHQPAQLVANNNGGVPYNVNLPPLVAGARSPSPTKRVTLVEPHQNDAGHHHHPATLSTRRLSDEHESHHHQADMKRRNTAVTSSDPHVAEILDKLKHRKAHGSAGSAKVTTKETTRVTINQSTSSKAADEVAKTSKQRGSKDDKTTKKQVEPKISARQRVLREFRARRKPKPKKKYVPMSKRIIKPPKVREKWDNVNSKISDDFHANENFQPLSRQVSTLGSVTSSLESLASIDGDESARSIRRPKILPPIKRTTSNLSSKSVLKKGSDDKLNKLAVLPPIKPKTITIVYAQSMGNGIMAEVNGKRDAISQVGTFETAVNTDPEQRTVGISTRDDVVFIYEKVKLSNKRRRHGHRKGKRRPSGHRRHRHHKRNNKSNKHKKSKKKRRSKSYSSSSSSSRSSPSSSSRSSSSSSSSTSSSSRSSSASSSTSRSRSASSRSSRSSSSSSSRSSYSRSASSRSSSPPSSRASRHSTTVEKHDKIAAKISSVVNTADLKKQLLGRLNSTSTAKPQTPQHAPVNQVPSIRAPWQLSQQISREISSSSIKSTGRSNVSKKSLTAQKSKVHATLSSTFSNSSQASRGSTSARKTRPTSKHQHSSVTKQHSSLSKQHSSVAKTLSNTSQSSQLSTTSSSAKSRASSRKSSKSKTSARGHSSLSKKDSFALDSKNRKRLSIVQENDRAYSSSPFKALQGAEVPVSGTVVLIPCRVCGRKFASSRITVHEMSCEKTHSTTRKVFDSQTRRLSNFASEDKSLLLQSIKTVNKPKQPTKSNAWREKHDAFIEQIRYAKKVTELEKTGGDIRSLGPAPKTFTGDLVSCPKCGRKFNAEAIKRHVPTCKATPIAKK